MGNQGRSEATLQPLAPSDFAMVMAKSRENRLAFATWLMFFRDYGRFPRGPSDLESMDVVALARQIEVTVPADGGLLLAERTAKRLRQAAVSLFASAVACFYDDNALGRRDPQDRGQVQPLVESEAAGSSRSVAFDGQVIRAVLSRSHHAPGTD